MQQVEFAGLTNALKVSLDNWGSKHGIYAPMFNGMSKALREVAHCFLEETKLLKPSGYEVWWAREHNRFIRSKLQQRELIVLHEIMYHFLSDFARGQLAGTNDTRKIGTIAPKAAIRSKQ